MLRSKETQIHDHLGFTWLDLFLDFCQVVVVKEDGEGDGDDGEGEKHGVVVVVERGFSEGRCGRYLGQ